MPPYSNFVRMLFVLPALVLFVPTQAASAVPDRDTVFHDDFESGWGSWWADNGIWDVGEPIVGPPGAHSGQWCAGTILDGNYPDHANTRLISSYITLPTVSGDERIKLKFWQWFNIENGNDQGVVQISVSPGVWETISSPEFDGGGVVWTQYAADLSDYAGETIRLGFYFSSDFSIGYHGWYIDDVSIEVGPPDFPNPEAFELGVGDWCADNGLWEVGEPTAGPPSAHSGENCAGTVLGGGYANHANTRLISPEITLTPAPGQFPMLFFYQWFTIESGYDNGWIQLSVNDGAWETIAGPITGTNASWSQYGCDLSAYSDASVRVAFLFTSDFSVAYSGWYIDDIRIEGIVAPCVGDLNGDGVVNVTDLLALLGNWGNAGTGDLNDDGTVNVMDLLELLGAWGACP
jgi:hypothetical protein